MLSPVGTPLQEHLRQLIINSALLLLDKGAFTYLGRKPPGIPGMCSNYGFGLFGFYGISILVGYSMPNPFVYE